MTERLLDLDGALEFLDGDVELRDQLLVVLLRVLDEAVRGLPGMVERRDWREIGDVAHQLAPSLSIFCPSVAAPVSALGAALRDDDEDRREALALRAVPLMEQVRAEVRRCVESRGR